MNRVYACAALALIALIPTVAVSAIGDVVPDVLTPKDKVEDGEAVRVVGKMITRDEEDSDGNVVTRAFLEQDDGGLIELPCERSNGDSGLIKRTAGSVLGKDSCWDYLGQEVEVLGTAQKMQRRGKRWLRLGRMTGINPL